MGGQFLIHQSLGCWKGLSQGEASHSIWWSFNDCHRVKSWMAPFPRAAGQICECILYTNYAHAAMKLALRGKQDKIQMPTLQRHRVCKRDSRSQPRHWQNCDHTTWVQDGFRERPRSRCETLGCWGLPPQCQRYCKQVVLQLVSLPGAPRASC